MAKLTPVGALGKWVIAPLAFILIGYYVVGPRIGKSTGTDSKDHQVINETPSSAPSSPAANSTEPSDKPIAPDVAVTVQKSDNQPKPRHRRSRRTDQKPAVAETQKPPPKPDHVVPPPDEGGSAGSTTAGGQA